MQNTLLRELRYFGKLFGRVLLFFYLPLIVIPVALHFPYDTDGEPQQFPNSRVFYEAAYAPAHAQKRGIDYEETARLAAERSDIAGQVRAFVATYHLENKRVLEIGSGRGYLQDIVPDYTGLDISPSVASRYHKPFVAGSATAIPFPDNAFDAIWTVWVLEHIAQPEKALSEMRRVLKPGGIMFLLVAWNCTPWAADGFDVRPFSDFNWRGKLVKASILPRSITAVFTRTEIRSIRLLATKFGTGTKLRYRRLSPNYDVYWEADGDAAVSLDSYEVYLWFKSRRDECLNCPSAWGELLEYRNPLVIKVRK